MFILMILILIILIVETFISSTTLFFSVNSWGHPFILIYVFIFSLYEKTKKNSKAFLVCHFHTLTYLIACLLQSFHTLAIPEFPIISYQILLGYVNRYHFNFTPFPLNFSLFNIFLMFLLKLSSDPHLPNNHILFLEENHPFPIISSPNHLSLSLML